MSFDVADFFKKSATETCTTSNEVTGSAAEGARVGRLLLFNVGQLTSESDVKTRLNLIQNVDTVGVLDIKWCNGDTYLPLFGAADSNGDLSLWSMNSVENSKLGIQLVEVMSTDDNDALALSLDWSTAVTQRYCMNWLTKVTS